MAFTHTSKQFQKWVKEQLNTTLVSRGKKQQRKKEHIFLIPQGVVIGVPSVQPAVTAPEPKKSHITTGLS